MKDLKIEHKNQSIMQVSQDRTMGEYLKDKPLLHPDLCDHTYCTVN